MTQVNVIIYKDLNQILIMVVSDIEIQSLMDEKKTLLSSLNPSFKDGRSSQRFEHDFEGEKGNKFKVVIRVSNFNPSDFSVILCVKLGGKWFRLRRYNGDSHEHTNSLEQEKVKGCHIHYATERYQERGFREEDYARSTNKYGDWKKALDILMKEANFQLAVVKGQRRLESNG